MPPRLDPEDMPEVMSSVTAARYLGYPPSWCPNCWPGAVRARLANPVRPRPAKPFPETRKGRRQAARRTELAAKAEAARVASGSRRLLTYAEVTERLGVSRHALRRYLERGVLRRVDLDENNKRITWESVERAIARGLL